jgi:hypothetical protein
MQLRELPLDLAMPGSCTSADVTTTAVVRGAAYVHREAMRDFSRNAACGREVLKTALTQLLLYYTRMLELLKRCGTEGAGLVRDAVTVPSIMYEIKRYNRKD